MEFLTSPSPQNVKLILQAVGGEEVLRRMKAECGGTLPQNFCLALVLEAEAAPLQRRVRLKPETSESLPLPPP